MSCIGMNSGTLKYVPGGIIARFHPSSLDPSLSSQYNRPMQQKLTVTTYLPHAQTYRQENARLRKQINEVNRELDKCKRDEEIIALYHEEQKAKREQADQLKELMEQWKDSLANIPFVCILY